MNKKDLEDNIGVCLLCAKKNCNCAMPQNLPNKEIGKANNAIAQGNMIYESDIIVYKEREEKCCENCREITHSLTPDKMQGFANCKCHFPAREITTKNYRDEIISKPAEESKECICAGEKLYYETYGHTKNCLKDTCCENGKFNDGHKCLKSPPIKLEIVPSPRTDWCGDYKKEHGFECPPKENWEIEFDSKFSKDFGGDVDIKENKNVPLLVWAIKSFIKSLLSQAKTEEREKVVSEVREKLRQKCKVSSIGMAVDSVDLDQVLLSIRNKE